ncbi:MAG: glycosyltransferase family 9 protein [Candidatus Kryptoniota bacterium]
MSAFDFKKILVIQTAFLGDVILTLPVVQRLKKIEANSTVDFVTIPETAEIVQNNKFVDNVFILDKHGRERNFASIYAFGKSIRRQSYDIVLCPHRSLRSALITAMSGASIRIGFENSALPVVFTQRVPWKFGVHEIDRNMSLLGALGLECGGEPPMLFPTNEDIETVEKFLLVNNVKSPFAVVAPGTVWPTKQYPVSKMRDVVKALLLYFKNVVIVGGKGDVAAAENLVTDKRVVMAAGKLRVLSSAEIVRRSSVIVANDSAAVHIASAFGTPTVAIFGPTIRDFGFYPYNKNSLVIEIEGLSCRPCSLHGGRRCPISTFECMNNIKPETVAEAAITLAERS